MKFKLQHPIKVNVDNKGYIFISINPTIKRTKNIDKRYHLICQYIKDGIISIEFVQTEKKNSYIMTKKLAKDKNYYFTTKDSILIESLINDGIQVPDKYISLLEIPHQADKEVEEA